MRRNVGHRFSVQAAAAAALLAAAMAAAGWSQGDAGQDKSIPTSKVERLNRAPVSKEILKVKLPRPIETTLPNGIHLMILEDHRVPLVTVQFDINGAGPLYEPAAQPGLAGATARLLAEGTKTRTSKQIAEQIDSLGASLSASAGFGSGTATVSASGLSDTFEQWFALTTDVLLHPSFPADELAQYQARAKPGSLAAALATWISGESNVEPRAVWNVSGGGRFRHARVARFADAGDARGLARANITRRKIRSWPSRATSTPQTLDPQAAKVAGGMAARSKVPVKFSPGPPPASKERSF